MLFKQFDTDVTTSMYRDLCIFLFFCEICQKQHKTSLDRRNFYAFVGNRVCRGHKSQFHFILLVRH